MSRFMNLNDTKTAYETRGEGPPLLLFHGLQGGRKMLEALVVELARDFKVISFDQRDSGETTNPPAAYDLAQLADDASKLVAGLGLERVNVFGTSFGARIAQAFAVLHPGQLDKLILGSTWALPQSMQDVNPTGLARFMEIRSRLPESANEMAELFVPGEYLAAHPDLRRLLLAMPDAPDRAQRRAQAAQTVVGNASDIAAPTLLIAGEVDQVVPAALTEAMLKIIRQSRFVCLPGVGHTTPLQATAELAAEIRTFVLT